LSFGRHEWICLVGAAIVHMTVPVTAAIAPPPPPHRWVTVKRAGPSEFNVDVDHALLDSARPRPRDPRLGPALGMPDADPNAPHNPNFDPGRPPTMSRNGSADPEELTGDPEDAVLSGPGESENDTFDPDGEFSNAPGVGEPWGTPGLDPNMPIYVYPGADFSPETGGDSPAPRKTKKRKYDRDAPTAAVQDEIRKKDAKLGLDFPGRGPIRSAFVSATYSSDSPYDASAVFALSVNPEGKVTSVSYVNHSGGKTSTWKRVGRVAHKQLKGVKLVMKSAFAKGAAVTVIITSKKKTPGGGTSRDGATIHFDTSDIGAKETRVVSAAVAPVPIK
jgi:hypothetical protein